MRPQLAALRQIDDGGEHRRWRWQQVRAYPTEPATQFPNNDEEQWNNEAERGGPDPRVGGETPHLIDALSTSSLAANCESISASAAPAISVPAGTTSAFLRTPPAAMIAVRCSAPITGFVRSVRS